MVSGAGQADMATRPSTGCRPGSLPTRTCGLPTSLLDLLGIKLMQKARSPQDVLGVLVFELTGAHNGGGPHLELRPVEAPRVRKGAHDSFPDGELEVQFLGAVPAGLAVEAPALVPSARPGGVVGAPEGPL